MQVGGYMALVNCPECGREVSNFADKCPGCGLKLNTLTAGMMKLTRKMETVRDEVQRDPEAFKARMEAKRAKSNPNITAVQAISIVFLLFLAVGAWVQFVDKPRDAKLAAERADAAAAEAYKNSPEGKKAARKAQIQQGFGFYGEHKELTKLIKADMDDPNSFELAACNWFDMDDHVVVIEDFRGRNAYGVMQHYSVKAKCGMKGEVIEMMNVKRMR
jgi:hypothetical protein